MKKGEIQERIPWQTIAKAYVANMKVKTRTAESLGMSMPTFYKYLKRYPGIEKTADRLIDEQHHRIVQRKFNRALNGIKISKVTKGGKLIEYYITDPDAEDFILKHYQPTDGFFDCTTKNSGTNVNIITQNNTINNQLDLSKLNTDQLRQFKELLELASGEQPEEQEVIDIEEVKEEKDE